MPTEYENQVNSTPVHYFASSGQRCHAAVVSGSFVVDVDPVSADLIQLDAVNLGVIVPLERAGVGFDGSATTNDTWHYQGSCPRG